MPILLWLLGIPIPLIILIMLLHLELRRPERLPAGRCNVY